MDTSALRLTRLSSGLTSCSTILGQMKVKVLRSMRMVLLPYMTHQRQGTLILQVMEVWSSGSTPRMLSTTPRICLASKWMKFSYSMKRWPQKRFLHSRVLRVFRAFRGHLLGPGGMDQIRSSTEVLTEWSVSPSGKRLRWDTLILQPGKVSPKI